MNDENMKLLLISVMSGLISGVLFSIAASLWTVNERLTSLETQVEVLK